MTSSPATATPPDRRSLVYTDEDVDRTLVEALRQRGFDVPTAHEAGTLGQHDEAQLAYAAAAGRVILSYNRADFRQGHRHFRQTGRQLPGIVLLPQVWPLLLDWLMTLDETTPPLANWNDLQLRLHAGYRLPNYSEHDVRVALGVEEG